MVNSHSLMEMATVELFRWKQRKQTKLASIITDGRYDSNHHSNPVLSVNDVDVHPAERLKHRYQMMHINVNKCFLLSFLFPCF